MFSKSLRERSASFVDVEFTPCTTGDVVNYIGRGACEMIPDSEARFGSRNIGCEIDERALVATGTRARKLPC